MGAKTRDNYSTGGWCGKTDCPVRDKNCDKCIRFSEYKKAMVTEMDVDYAGHTLHIKKG